MFTGIVQGMYPISDYIRQPKLLKYSVQCPPEVLEDLKIGASISIDGICQTVVKIENHKIWFDAIEETLIRTTLSNLEVGQWVNFERAARLGDEVGGHFVSGHIYGKVQILKIEELFTSRILTFSCNLNWIKYLFPKGFVALDGVSLTLVDIVPQGEFTVHLIPETLQKTILGQKKVGDWVNLELDSHTQAIVETVERILSKKKLRF